MQEYTQVQKAISVIIILALIVALEGCAGYRVIPNANLSDYTKYPHIIYGGKSKYVLDSTKVSNGMLSGPVDLTRYTVKNAIHVYPFSKSGIKIDSMGLLTLPIDQINKVKVSGVYMPKEYVYSNSSKKPKRENEPAGQTVLKSIYYLTGLMITSSLAWWIFENKRH